MKPLLTGLAVLALGTVANASVVANFTDGTGTSSPDSYTGAAGAGWVGAWSLSNASPSAGNGTVTNTSPLTPSGGNYLSISTSSTSGGAASAWTRQYGAGVIALNAVHTISWSFRVDETIGTGFNGGNDRYQFYGNRNNSSGFNSSSTVNEWFVFASGATPATANGTFVAKNWEFYSGGATTAFGDGTIVDSGITLVTGTTYYFTIVNDPTTRTYVATVSDGTNSFTSGTLNWRDRTAGSSGGYFTASMVSTTANEVRSASIDDVLIIPEPSTVMLLVPAGALMLRRRRK